MKQFEEELYICQFHSSKDYFLSSHKEVSDYAVILGKKKITVDIPELSEAEIVNQRINALQQKRNDVRAKAQLECNRIEDEISKLLAIEAK